MKKILIIIGIIASVSSFASTSYLKLCGKIQKLTINQGYPIFVLDSCTDRVFHTKAPSDSMILLTAKIHSLTVCIEADTDSQEAFQISI